MCFSQNNLIPFKIHAHTLYHCVSFHDRCSTVYTHLVRHFEKSIHHLVWLVSAHYYMFIKSCKYQLIVLWIFDYMNCEKEHISCHLEESRKNRTHTRAPLRRNWRVNIHKRTTKTSEKQAAKQLKHFAYPIFSLLPFAACTLDSHSLPNRYANEWQRLEYSNGTKCINKTYPKTS